MDIPTITIDSREKDLFKITKFLRGIPARLATILHNVVAAFGVGP